MGNADNVQVIGPMHERYEEILTPEALGLLGALHREFNATPARTAGRRADRVAGLAAGKVFDFLEETKAVREDPSWRVAPAAPGLVDRG